ncbi:hypothetical protein San01_38170 [Streptomyces angustmyceticus]|uniref:Uncharacterized protein n=1 Tax=Streptomyces angustmyceticus TaxID=285578 RepID=A0A5J4LIB7_9ACTN|nr:hypothetical protein San01_38170 [Streptomyces angustmyceticus]
MSADGGCPDRFTPVVLVGPRLRVPEGRAGLGVGGPCGPVVHGEAGCLSEDVSQLVWLL